MDNTELARRYIALWNETDPDQRLEAVRAVLGDTATYSDPQMTGAGHQGISDMIGAAQAQLPGLRFRLSETPVEAHHEFLRFSWLLGPDEQTSLAGGTDIVEVKGSQIQKIIGFIDFAPPTA